MTDFESAPRQARHRSHGGRHRAAPAPMSSLRSALAVAALWMGLVSTLTVALVLT